MDQTIVPMFFTPFLTKNGILRFQLMTTFVFTMEFGIHIQHLIVKRIEQMTYVSILHWNFSHRFIYRIMKGKIIT